jgi:hypothetical protein
MDNQGDGHGTYGSLGADLDGGRFQVRPERAADRGMVIRDQGPQWLCRCWHLLSVTVGKRSPQPYARSGV